uniref:Proline-rich protein PRCC n=1 Tax=Leersia perrieri TaxID=77586 RepID=A0A0D9VCU0_9ORYZ
MDSLLASYASSDDDADETLPTPAASVPAAAAAATSGGIFSSLPQPKSAPLFSTLPAPKSGPVFSAIPPPKSSSGANPKRVVQFRPPPIRQPTGESSDEEDDADDAGKRRPSEAEPRPSVFAGSGISSFLPPPKHSLGLGSGAARRSSAIDTAAAAPERSNFGAVGGPSSNSAVNAVAAERADTSSADNDDDESNESDGEDGMALPDEQQEQQQEFGSEAGEQQHQQQSYDAGAGSSNGQEGYAWDPNYYANYGASYGRDPSGNVDYGTGAQYAEYGGEHGGVYGNSYGGEHTDGYGHLTGVSYGGGYTGGYEHNAAAMTAPPIQEPLLPPEVGRIGGKRGRSGMPAEILEVNQAELMKNRPREDKSKLTGMAFGPSYQPAPSAKGKPSKLHKRKHQIGSLFFDMKQKEMELAERRSKGFLTKAETQAKYGW